MTINNVRILSKVIHNTADNKVNLRLSLFCNLFKLMAQFVIAIVNTVNIIVETRAVPTM